MSADAHDGTDRSTAPADEGDKLGTLARGPDMELRVRAKVFEAHRYIDLRLWSRRGADQPWWPVKGKGVSIKLRELDDVIAALERAR